MSRPHRYGRFRALDGSHPLREAAPGAYVDYAARRRRGGQVAYFNFALARQMGLIPGRHPDRLNQALRRAILDAFAVVIINEHDLARRAAIPARERLPRRYMATRYLQLQHPGRQGRTSGDGRSLWNGCVRHRGVTWDVTSCGTGVTRLCPATAEQGRFFRTGSYAASYGCGTAALAEGLSAALMSEVFHRAGLATERVLAVIALPGGYAINVRAGRNLLRPSHFFAPLKQNDLPRLRGLADAYIARQVGNGDWPALRPGRRAYRYLAEATARAFGRAAAAFEREYIFCWLDWDGDNILTDGGVIDYGSVRQFGLYHRSYRFRDVGRMSTTLPEQRRKARYIVQTFAQLRDFLCSGRRTPLDRYRDDPVLAVFDAAYTQERDRRLVEHLGLDPPLQQLLPRRESAALERFRRVHHYFERARAARGPRRVPDGLNWNAIFCTRDLLRELPARYAADPRPLPPRAFLELAASRYASRTDRALRPHRVRMVREFQRAYLDLMERAAARAGVARATLLWRAAASARRLHRPLRMTGNAVDHATDVLIRQRKRLSDAEFHALIERFLRRQDPALPPDAEEGSEFDALLAEFRYGL